MTKTYNNPEKTVVVGMSGGVDSSVAALLLKQQGYRVIGITMQIWQDPLPGAAEKEGGCCGVTAAADARRVADVIGIPHYVMNFQDIFREKVIDYFTEAYIRGETPNPCIACNRYVKWEALLSRSLAIGADYIATGHYARTARRGNGRFALQCSATPEKDQTYALYNLTQEQLSRTIFPLGEYTKPEVRRIAEEAGLPVAHKKDSQEICFVPDNDYAAFIERERSEVPPPGNFVTGDGTVLGRHRGITHYTIGQRRGLDLPMGRRVFVKELRPETNEVVIGEAEEMFANTLRARSLNFMGIPPLAPGSSGDFLAKIRYNHRGTMCRVARAGEDEITCSFYEPVRAVTPGQAVVFYEDGWVAGGGIIVR